MSGQARLLAGALVVLFGVGQVAQPGVPVRFEGVGGQPVGGVDGQVAAAGGVSGVPGPLHVGGAQRVGLLGLGLQLGGDLQGSLDGQRGERVQHQAGDGGVTPDPQMFWQGGVPVLMPSRWHM